MSKIYLFTFCVFFGKQTKNELINTLKLLIHSLEKYNNYELFVFKNFDINIKNNNVKFFNYFENNNFFSEKWYNLSFNKLAIYRYLYNEYKINFVWIDLDTIVTHNIEYINDVDSYFVENGGASNYNNPLFHNNPLSVLRNRYIQGNIWKININLYDELIKTFNELRIKNLKLRYDGQDLFNYYIYHKLDGKLNENNIYIAGLNYKPETINGLCVWSNKGNTHATLEGLNNMYYEGGKLRSNFYPNKEIHILSFTFFTLNNLINTPKFKDLFLINN